MAESPFLSILSVGLPFLSFQNTFFFFHSLKTRDWENRPQGQESDPIQSSVFPSHGPDGNQSAGQEARHLQHLSPCPLGCAPFHLPLFITRVTEGLLNFVCLSVLFLRDHDLLQAHCFQSGLTLGASVEHGTRMKALTTRGSERGIFNSCHFSA